MKLAFRIGIGIALAATSASAFLASPRGMPQLALRHAASCRPASVLMMAKSKTDTKIQVLLKEVVEGVGKKNEVVKVNSGYYNNFLRPKNLASIISDEGVQEKVAKEKEDAEKIKQDAIEMGTFISNLGPIVLKRKVGKDNNIFGAITHKQIADLIEEKSKGQIKFGQKMKWTVPEVKGLGEFSCSVQLHPDVPQTVKVKVEAEK